MTRCIQCHISFEIPPQEEHICHALGIPLPDICPRCSWQRHFSFRNDMHLYRRTCDATGKELLSVYAPDAAYTIYDYTVWNSDVWDAADYCRDIDFTRPFFEQFAELQRQVPRPSKFIPKSLGENINSEYTNLSIQLKNCYMVFSAAESQECYYGELYYKSKDCVDGLKTFYSELCYETVEVQRCYHCQFLLNCRDCTDCIFMVDCFDCQHCFGCVNLKNKQYCFFNVQLNKSDYEEKIKRYSFGSFSDLTRIKGEFEEFLLTQPRKHAHIIYSEQCTGDYIENSKGCTNAFLAFFECENSANMLRVAGIKDSARVTNNDALEQGYEVTNCTNFPGGTQRVAFCMSCIGAVFNLWYCDLCDNTQSCFGCVGLRKKSYCILNKQYGKEEYEALTMRLTNHMKETSEWGKFFPTSLSPFAYNETFAIDYFPLSKEQAHQRGFRWRDAIDASVGTSTLDSNRIADHIQDVSDTIINEILSCIACKRNYKIVKQELAFYRKHGLPVPRTCFRCRHIDRLSLRNGISLYSRTCACTVSDHDHAGQCSSVFDTTYAPEDKARVFCESCYQKL